MFSLWAARSHGQQLPEQEVIFAGFASFELVLEEKTGRPAAVQQQQRSTSSLFAEGDGSDVSVPYDAAARLAYDAWLKEFRERSQPAGRAPTERTSFLVDVGRPRLQKVNPGPGEIGGVHLWSTHPR